MGVQARGLVLITPTLAQLVTKWLKTCDLYVGPKMVAEMHSRQASWVASTVTGRFCSEREVMYELSFAVRAHYWMSY